MNVVSAALVLLTSAKGAAGTGCPLVVPTGVWAQGAAHQAVSDMKFSVNPPIKSQGFNRTAAVTGLCSDLFSVSTSFTCKTFVGGGEFSAGAPESDPVVALKFGGASCPLTGISAYKTPNGEFEAELRLQFDNCVGALVKTSAAVVVGIVPDPVKDSNLVAWSEDVCKAPKAAPLSSATVSVKSEAKMQLVGAGMCSATDRKTIPNIATAEKCKLQCLGSETKATILGTAGCTGFAFNKDTSSCKTYSGNVTQAVDTPANKGWECYNMDHKVGGYSKVTPAPPVAVKETEMLNIHEVLGTFATAFVQQITPLPVDCANVLGSSLWWFTLQDKAGKTQAVPVKEGVNWKALMDKLPTATPTANKITAPQVVDRVMFNTCEAPSMMAKNNVQGWAAESCFVAPSTSDCRKKEVTNTIIASVITCIVTCALVAFAFFLYWKLKGRKNIGAGYSALEESGSLGSHLCNGNVSCGLSVIAICSAAIACWISLTFISSIPPGTKGCYNEKEFLLPILATGISVALTIIVFLYYVGTSHKAHPHPFLVQPSKVKEEGKTTLMLVEVEDGQNQGVQLGSVTASSQGKLYTSFTTSANQFDYGNSPAFQSQQSSNGSMMQR